jgi:UDP-glucose 4-epimerase
MKILVTGGCGFIGSKLVRKLVSLRHDVCVLDNLMRGSFEGIEDLVDKGVCFVDGDIRYRDCVDSVMDGVDVVFHLAATNVNRSMRYPEECFDINFNGSHIVFKSALVHNVKKVVFSSSASVYGQPKFLPMVEDMELYPITPYCVSKLACEGLLKFFSRQDLSFIALRYFNVYGIGQRNDAYYTSVIIRFAKNVALGSPPLINGKGDQSMDFVYVDDVVDANILALRSKVSNEIFNVGTGVSTSVNDLAYKIIELSGKSLSPAHRLSPSPELVSERRASTVKAERLLGFKHSVSLDKGLKKVVADIIRHPRRY